jgi:hypothetical protein
LARYALWQAVDFLFERAVAIVLILALFLYLSHFTISSTPRPPGSDLSVEILRALAPLLMSNVLGTAWITVGLLAVNGISSNDRATGRFRFLFSKPVRADAYYAQAFVVNIVLASVCLLSAVLLLSHWTASPMSFTRDAALIAASGVIGIGGLCFFFSAVFRFDWLGTVGVWAGVLLLRMNYPGAAWLRFLPPTSAVGTQIENLGAQRPVDLLSLLWFLLFGLVSFAVGLVILRRRPLST